MNDHNLDDLIIDTIAPKNNKTKSLLTIIALLIIVLIVAIILTKTLLKTPETDELTFEENMSKMIAPELQLQAQEEVKVTEVSKPKEELPLSHSIKEEMPAPEEVKKEEKEQEVVQETKKPLEIKKEKVQVQVQAPYIKEVSKKPIAKPFAKPIVNTTTKPTVTTKPKPKKLVKKESKKPTQKPTKKPAVIAKAPQTDSTGKYYVQVSSFKSAAPSNRLLTVIKSSGFSSHVSAPDRTGYKKLLIGPYKTRADVDKARDIIRDRILKSAFVVER